MVLQKATAGRNNEKQKLKDITPPLQLQNYFSAEIIYIVYIGHSLILHAAQQISWDIVAVWEHVKNPCNFFHILHVQYEMPN